MLDPKNFGKIGAWPNGGYFNGLLFEGEDPRYYQKMFGFDYGAKNLITVDDNFFYPIENIEFCKTLAKKDTANFLKTWNELCSKAMDKLKEYAYQYRNDDFENVTDEELLKAKQEFEEEFKSFIPFLNPLVYFAEVFEEYVVKKIPHINFKEARPIHRISAERLNDDLVEGKKSLEELEKEYGWYNMNLVRGKPLTIEDLKEIKKTAKKTSSTKISENELIKSLQMMLWLKFERIDAFNYALYHMSKLYYEIFKRINIDKKYWDVFLPAELSKALLTKEIPQYLDQRFSNRGVIKENNTVRHLTVEEFEEYKKLFVLLKPKDGIIKGTVACQGIVRGTVKIVKGFDDLSKLEKGDILVATETLVQYEPYMHKTAAMVVEMGGMLCHTSIFAREFQIPTIVGVNGITNLLKDGDLVEVDANKGVVKKIK